MVTTIGVLGLVAVLGCQLYVRMQRHSQVQRARLDLLAQARNVRHALLSDVRRSAGVVSSAGRYRSGASTLILRLPSLAEARYVVYRQTPQGIERALVGLERSARIPETERLAEDLDTLRFSTESLGPRTLVEAEVAGKDVVRRRPVSVSLSFAAATRGGAP